MKKLIQEELEEERMVGLLLSADTSDNFTCRRQFLIMGPRGHEDLDGELPPIAPEFLYQEEAQVLVTTRGQMKTQRDTAVEDVRVPLEALGA